MYNPINVPLDTILKIPRSEAILLPNKTYPIKDQPGYYIAELDVFHQLHCLVSSGYIMYTPFKLTYPHDRTMLGVLSTVSTTSTTPIWTRSMYHIAWIRYANP